MKMLSSDNVWSEYVLSMQSGFVISNCNAVMTFYIYKTLFKASQICKSYLSLPNNFMNKYAIVDKCFICCYETIFTLFLIWIVNKN